MTVVSGTFPRAFVVRFRDLYRWDPSSFHKILWHWPASVLRPLGNAFKVRKEKVDRTKVKFSDLQPITIHFDGSVDRRKVDENREYSMELFVAKPGDIVVSKIDLKNGAVGIVPEGWDNVVVTGHFAVYEPDRSKLMPEYLHLLIQANFFKSHLWRNKVGAEGRKEVKLDFFEAELIPFPPFSVQQKVVAAWEATKKTAAETTEKIEQLERDIEARFLADLGIENRQFARLPKCFAMPWRLAERWSVEFLTRKAFGLSEVETGKYDDKPLSLLVKGVSGSTPSKGASQFWGGSVPWVSPKDMKTEIIIDSVDHISEDAIHKRMAPLLPANSVLVVMRSGILQRTVPVALARRPVSINQDMRALIVKNKAYLLPSFLAVYLQCRRADLLKLVKWSTTVQSINTKELESFPIPLPPLPIQGQIVECVVKHREEIAKLKAEAKARAAAAKADVEAMILGTKKVGTT
jgi:type I restriction enzyme, S subunit